MEVHSNAQGYLVELTNTERSALVWALEAGRALLLGDPNLAVLAAEDAVRPDLLDDLTDRLFLAGCRAAPSE
jgi:hypothetical protein